MVYAALAGNVLVALSKFGAAFVSGSSAMLFEAIRNPVYMAVFRLRSGSLCEI